jgi:hypothetical protein
MAPKRNVETNGTTFAAEIMAFFVPEPARKDTA